MARQAEAGLRRDSPAYAPLAGLPGFPMSACACPRAAARRCSPPIPCGSGAAGCGSTRCSVLWLVPTGAILTQTVEALKNRSHAYRHGSTVLRRPVRILGIDDLGRSARPTCAATPGGGRHNPDPPRVRHRVAQGLCPQREYGALFAGAPAGGLETVSGDEAARSLWRLTEGRPKYSFANLMHIHRPLMIVDEAHNAVTGLTREMQARVNPSAIVEFTHAAPQLQQPAQRDCAGVEGGGDDQAADPLGEHGAGRPR